MKIGLIGFGTIGSRIGSEFKEEIVWVVDIEDMSAQMRKAGVLCPLYFSIPKRCGGADLVVEAASQQAVAQAIPCLRYADLMIMSVGALADEKVLASLVENAKKYGRKVLIPSGAIGGLDAISAVAEIAEEVVLETTKPPSSLGREDKEKVVVFEGKAKDACRLFPQNINVSATLALAGVGFEKTKVRIISDPKQKNNLHKITVISRAGKMVFEFDNLPSPQNPKTSALAALSAINTIRKISRTLQIG
ncbi:MAG: aspartate dehydrogenase [Candidatus Anstonellaceae archaeon]